MSLSTIVHLERCLKRVGERGSSSRIELMEFARCRWRLLAERMFLRFPDRYSQKESEQLFQDAMDRLWQSWESIRPTAAVEFLKLTAVQMRRSLLELAGNHSGRDHELDEAGSPKPLATWDHDSDIGLQADDLKSITDILACWGEFHAAVERLAESHRTIFDLLFYYELPQFEVAELLKLSARHVQLDWIESRLTLAHSCSVFAMLDRT